MKRPLGPLRLAGIAALVVGCAAEPLHDWGPLAVTDENAQAAAAALGGEGELRIDGECVTLPASRSDRRITLVWRSGQTAWDPTTHSIVFDDIVNGVRMRLSDGDRISVGGTGTSHPRWLAPPHDSCPPQLFTVHTVTRLEQ